MQPLLMSNKLPPAMGKQDISQKNFGVSQPVKVREGLDNKELSFA